MPDIKGRLPSLDIRPLLQCTCEARQHMDHGLKFKTALRNREDLVGVFVKIPHPHIVELLATTQIDFIVLDAEHSPFSIAELDMCVLAAKANTLPCLVRIRNHLPDHIGAILDIGADGIIAPHIRSLADAKAIVSACRYRSGSRGASMSHRSGAYGTGGLISDYATSADESTIIVAQIEDREALDQLSDICSESRIDGFFMGKVDLMFSCGYSDPEDPDLLIKLDAACSLLTREKRALGAFLTNSEDVPPLREQGHSFIALGSDHFHLRQSVSAFVSAATK